MHVNAVEAEGSQGFIRVRGTTTIVMANQMDWEGAGTVDGRNTE